MCVGDYKLGRLVRSIVRQGLFNVGGEITLLRNPDRVGVTIFPPSSANIQITIDQPAGLTTSAFMEPTHDLWNFNLLTHGDLPTREWHIIKLTGQGNIMVIEFTLPETVLAGDPPAG